MLEIPFVQTIKCNFKISPLMFPVINLLVQNELMKNSDMEKYFGDIIHKDGKQHTTIVEILTKGYGIVANTLALLSDIPLGHRRIETGLELLGKHGSSMVYSTTVIYGKNLQKKI